MMTEPPPPRDQMRYPGLDGLPHPAEIDVDGFFPDVLAHFVQLDAGGADAGVGHDDVQPAQLLDPAVDGGLQRVVVTDVDLVRDDAAVEAFDLSAVSARSSGVAAGAVESLERPADVDGDDVGALLGQPDRVAAALPARRAGDECNLALDPTGHHTPSLVGLGFLVRTGADKSLVS